RGQKPDKKLGQEAGRKGLQPDARKAIRRLHPLRARNSAVECHLHTVEAIGSNPIAPTTKFVLREPPRDGSRRWVGRTQRRLPSASTRASIASRASLRPTPWTSR